MEEREEIIKIISKRVGGIVFESDDDIDTWVNMDKAKSKELKEKIQDLEKGDKVKIKGYDKEGKAFYTEIDKIEITKIQNSLNL